MVVAGSEREAAVGETGVTVGSFLAAGRADEGPAAGMAGVGMVAVVPDGTTAVFW